MKRFTALLLVCVLLMSMTFMGCGASETETASTETETETSTETETEEEVAPELNTETPVAEVTNDPDVKVINIWSFKSKQQLLLPQMALISQHLIRL